MKIIGDYLYLVKFKQEKMADIFYQLKLHFQKWYEPIGILHEGKCFGNRAHAVSNFCKVFSDLIIQAKISMAGGYF